MFSWVSVIDISKMNKLKLTKRKPLMYAFDKLSAYQHSVPPTTVVVMLILFKFPLATRSLPAAVFLLAA